MLTVERLEDRLCCDIGPPTSIPLTPPLIPPGPPALAVAPVPQPPPQPVVVVVIPGWGAINLPAPLVPVTIRP
jgi:hypothetical protein